MKTNTIKVTNVTSKNIVSNNISTGTIYGQSSLAASNLDCSSINVDSNLDSVVKIKANNVIIDQHLNTESIARILNFIYRNDLDSLKELINESIDPNLEQHLLSLISYDKDFILERFKKNLDILNKEEKDWEQYSKLFEYFISKFSTRAEYNYLLSLLPDSEKTPYWHSNITELINNSLDKIRYFKDFILD
jgi:hypothetical protein